MTRWQWLQASVMQHNVIDNIHVVRPATLWVPPPTTLSNRERKYGDESTGFLDWVRQPW